MFQKKIILKPEDNGDEPPDGLNVALPLKKLGILNPAVVQEDNKVVTKPKSYEK